MSTFTPLHDQWEPTRATLHAYAQGVGAISRAHGLAHPKWWHLSLKVRPTGLATDSLGLPDGGVISLRMDLRRHATVLETSRGDRIDSDMTVGATGTEFGGSTGPVQLWPHGFDVAVEWFGTRTEKLEEHGEIVEQQSPGTRPGRCGIRGVVYSLWPSHARSDHARDSR